jgi:peptidoglycan/xylan/chitin deacetylase (PgdA/CDA1 family)
VFLVADLVGHSNRWDRAYGEDLPLLGWDQVRRLAAQGVEFGSHSATHRPMTALVPSEVVRESARSRAALTRELQQPVLALAYPHGDTDPVVQHLVGGCGYLYGLTCTPGRARLGDSPLALPRIEITGFDSLTTFQERLRPFHY